MEGKVIVLETSIKSLKIFYFKLSKAFGFLFMLYSYNAISTFFSALSK